MRYDAISVGANGKAHRCPNCDNEEIISGDFCMICGIDLVNHCSDTPAGRHGSDPHVIQKSCGTRLPGNARYCPKCGNESSFFQKGWLRDWKSENPKQAIRNTRLADLYEFEEKA